jgi:hypothetical protein
MIFLNALYNYFGKNIALFSLSCACAAASVLFLLFAAFYHYTLNWGRYAGEAVGAEDAGHDGRAEDAEGAEYGEGESEDEEDGAWDGEGLESGVAEDGGDVAALGAGAGDESDAGAAGNAGAAEDAGDAGDGEAGAGAGGAGGVGEAGEAGGTGNEGGAGEYDGYAAINTVGGARAPGDARIADGASAPGRARISGGARIPGSARIPGDARIPGSAGSRGAIGNVAAIGTAGAPSGGISRPAGISRSAGISRPAGIFAGGSGGLGSVMVDEDDVVDGFASVRRRPARPSPAGRFADRRAAGLGQSDSSAWQAANGAAGAEVRRQTSAAGQTAVTSRPPARQRHPQGYPYADAQGRPQAGPQGYQHAAPQADPQGYPRADAQIGPRNYLGSGAGSGERGFAGSEPSVEIGWRGYVGARPGDRPSMGGAPSQARAWQHGAPQAQPGADGRRASDGLPHGARPDAGLGGQAGNGRSATGAGADGDFREGGAQVAGTRQSFAQRGGTYGAEQEGSFHGGRVPGGEARRAFRAPHAAGGNGGVAANIAGKAGSPSEKESRGSDWEAQQQDIGSLRGIDAKKSSRPGNGDGNGRQEQ